MSEKKKAKEADSTWTLHILKHFNLFTTVIQISHLVYNTNAEAHYNNQLTP